MHNSALQIGKLFFEIYCFSSCKILDVGSYNVNGTLRDVAGNAINYVGVDVESGPGVDVVLADPYVFPFENSTFDAIVTSSVFEHTSCFWITLTECFRVLKPNGYLYINAPSNGTFHQYPADYWRFYPDAGHAFVYWLSRSGYESCLVESGISPQGDEHWNDFFVVLKKSALPISRDRFISDEINGVKNVYRSDRKEISNYQEITEDQLLTNIAVRKLDEIFVPSPNLLRRYIEIYMIGCLLDLGKILPSAVRTRCQRLLEKNQSKIISLQTERSSKNSDKLALK